MSDVPTTMCSVPSAAYNPRCTGNDPSVLDVVNDGLGAFFSATANLVKAAVDIDTYIPLAADPYLLIATDVPARRIFPNASRVFAPTDEQYAADLASVEYSYLNPAYWIDQPLHAAHSFSTSFGTALPAGAALAVGFAPEAFGIGVPANFSALATSRSPTLLVIEGAETQASTSMRVISELLDPFRGRRLSLNEAYFVGDLVDRFVQLEALRDRLSALWWQTLDGERVLSRVDRLLTDAADVLADPIGPAKSMPVTQFVSPPQRIPAPMVMPLRPVVVPHPIRRSAPAAPLAAAAP